MLSVNTLKALPIRISDSWMQFSGVVPIIKDSQGKFWVYFGVERRNKKTTLAILGGHREVNDHEIYDTAIREFDEESLDIFKAKPVAYANQHSIDFSVFFTTLFFRQYQINEHFQQKRCDTLSKLFHERRYEGKGHYKKLSSAQKEMLGVVKVPLESLLEVLFVEKNNELKISYSAACQPIKQHTLPFRWSTWLLLTTRATKQYLSDL